LVHQLLRGAAQALPALFQLHRDRLLRLVVLRMDPRLLQRSSPEDVLQDAWADVQQQLPSWLGQPEPRVDLYVWLRGLTLNRLWKVQEYHFAQRRDVRREALAAAASSLHLANWLLGSQSSPSHAARQEELQRRVGWALERLRPRDREVILLRHFEGLSPGQTAQALGLQESAATMRYVRAIDR